MPKTPRDTLERVASDLPVAVSQILTSPALPPQTTVAEASWRPSGLKATHITGPVWPRPVQSSLPLAASHSFTSPGSLVAHWPAAEAKQVPSGLQATLVRWVEWPAHVNKALSQSRRT